MTTQPPQIVFDGIEPGDFIRCRWMAQVCGFVIGETTYGGRLKLRGYRITQANGTETIIHVDDAVLVSPSERRWQAAARQLLANGE